ncbi:unnamed protein product [Ectocarpus sp. CCAP 1310/34]|nr:unnamed protein product [Ectocarpus sp. CCAP 1310/34]
MDIPAVLRLQTPHATTHARTSANHSS